MKWNNGMITVLSPKNPAEMTFAEYIERFEYEYKKTCRNKDNRKVVMWIHYRKFQSKNEDQ